MQNPAGILQSEFCARILNFFGRIRKSEIQLNIIVCGFLDSGFCPQNPGIIPITRLGRRAAARVAPSKERCLAKRCKNVLRLQCMHKVALAMAALMLAMHPPTPIGVAYKHTANHHEPKGSTKRRTMCCQTIPNCVAVAMNAQDCTCHGCSHA